MSNLEPYDYIIAGAGPAGLQLGYFLQRARRNYLILEAGDGPGSFFGRFPRHRRLLSINKVYTGYEDPEINLRFDWNSLLSDGQGGLLSGVTHEYFPDADDLRHYLAGYADRCALNAQYGVRIVKISKGDVFSLLDADGAVRSCKCLIIATGVSRSYLPPIPGIDLAEDYTEMPVEPKDFQDQRVLIIGKGNSGFETANNLTEMAARIHVISPASVEMAWQTHFPGHLRAINNDFLDTYQLKTQNAVIDATVDRIERQGHEYLVTVSYSHAHGETEQLRYDRVLSCTGFRFDSSIFDESCPVQLTINDRFPSMTSAWESTSTPDLFFAGVLMYSRDVKKAASGFIHGFRYNIRALHRMLECRYHGGTWPSRRIDADPRLLADAILSRVNTSSALWQQFGFLCDTFVAAENGKSVEHYEELPVGYLGDSEVYAERRYLALTLEYGPKPAAPFAVLRNPSPERAAESTFLHPVLRQFIGRTKVAEHHLLENLFGEWQDERLHREPLIRFLAQSRSTPG